MARKKHAEEHVNLERWLVSYADFITLLFATFVVLYALSQIDLEKFKDLKVSMRKAFSSSPTVLKGDEGILSSKKMSITDSGGNIADPAAFSPVLQRDYAKQEESDFKEASKKLANENLKNLKGSETEINERGLVIKLLGNVVFEPASSIIKKGAYSAVEEVASLIKTKFPNHLIRVEGHTDNLPMKSMIYPSNWELSSARAAAIVRYMSEKFNIPENRFSVVGYSDSRPVASNKTKKGREKNRRVEIVILRNKFIKTEILAKEFKKDLDDEIEKFKHVAEQKKKFKKESNAVQKLLKEMGRTGDVIIIDKSKDSYKDEAAKILADLKEKERQATEDAKARRQRFFKSASDKFNHK